MRILIVNDDSIAAPGIALLAQIAREFGETWVVAPAGQCSAMSQKLTLRESMLLEQVTDFPVEVRNAYRLDGTPVDCVKVALEYLMEEKPDWVFSGINNGYNVGHDIAYSGTLGAAFEAVRCGIPAIAFSITSESHLEAAKDVLRSIVQELLESPPEPDAVWNVNIPGMRTKPLAGILRERTVAPVPMYQHAYLCQPHSCGGVLLTRGGTPTPDHLLPAGTDAHAVRNGYISIGKVRWH